jgi:hypothetical protein
MNDMYAFIDEAEPLKKIESHRQIVVQMMKHTVECGYFIRDYAKNRDFCMSVSLTHNVISQVSRPGQRTLRHLLSGDNSRVKQYQDKFGELKLALQGHAIIHTEINTLEAKITVLHISDAVQHVGVSSWLSLQSTTCQYILNTATGINLDDMPYAKGAMYCAEKGCLPDTRAEIIDNIIDWVNEDTDNVARICLLSGVAGVGKSAIAHELARRFDMVGHLGSSYFFDRAHQAERRPENVFSTIARDLADLNREWKNYLRHVIQDQRALRTTNSPRLQFKKFILDPAKRLMTVGPIIVVIDGLDESGGSESRQEILSVLGSLGAELPSNFRIIATARAERDIQEALDGKRHVTVKYMEDIDVVSANHDITLFVQTQLDDVKGLENKPQNEWCRLLVEKSEGLFQWASTACRFIKGDGEEGLSPVEQLDVLVSSASPNAHLSHLDQLYLGILMRIFNKTQNHDRMRRFISIMGTMLAAREPLSMFSLGKLCIDEDAAAAVELIILPMGSLLSGVARKSDLIRPLHTSFRDFLTDANRSGIFYIDEHSHHRSLALQTLRVMTAELAFNICRLETSYVRNVDVTDLAERVDKFISPQLSYSCRFWGDHLGAVSFDPDIDCEIRDFLSTRLLFWLEVLSLIKKVNVGLRALGSTIKWAPVSILVLCFLT